jgi:hypothetical protein
LDYARERAARERCEALLPEPAEIWLSHEPDGKWLVGAEGCDGGLPWIGATPTEAYLALAGALEKRGFVTPPSPSTGRQNEMTTGTDLIAAERQRQIEVEGWTPEHDQTEQLPDDLALAAACYALPIEDRHLVGNPPIPHIWPWAARWYKPVPNDRIRELVKAGALIAAEIDLRLSRQSDPSSSSKITPPSPR